MMSNLREPVRSAKRIVVKVGSSSISGQNEHQIESIVGALAARIRSETEVVLVSSGAIATGMTFLQVDSRPHELATQQAAAAVGQSVLISKYQRALDQFTLTAAQVLLTSTDLANPTPRTNALRAMERLLALGILPIVNENDTVATHEIRFGDNDRLAALVSILIGADILILLSDVESLYTKPPQEPGAERIKMITVDDNLDHLTFGSTVVNGVGTGGASTKVNAARLAARAGIGVVVTSSARAMNALNGDSVGTWFEPSDHPDVELPSFRSTGVTSSAER